MTPKEIRRMALAVKRLERMQYQLRQDAGFIDRMAEHEWWSHGKTKKSDPEASKTHERNSYDLTEAASVMQSMADDTAAVLKKIERAVK
jgi:hypothetical protein